MSGPAPQPNDFGAAWRALSGDATIPAHGGWQQPWQDEHGQWHSPYAHLQPPGQAPPYADAAGALAEPQPAPPAQAPAGYAQATPRPAAAAEPTDAPQAQPFVQREQLAPVGPPRYLAPQRAVRDPRQRSLAAVITFVALLAGLWGILGFTGSLSKTLTSINGTNTKLQAQMKTANVGLVGLDEKTRPLAPMGEESARMRKLLGVIDADLGNMVGGVESIAAGMSEMGTSLETLDAELATVNEVNAGMATQLGSINAGLRGQLAKVRTMRRDVQATGAVLGTLPPRLRATNARLAHVNGAVNTMGCRGVLSNLKVKIGLGPIPTGAAEVYATVVPPAAWGTKADGRTPC